MATVNRTEITWLNGVLANLEKIEMNSADFLDEDEILPSSTSFLLVKKFLLCLQEHQFAGSISEPRMRISPNGDIVLVWENDKFALDVRFRAEQLEPSCSLVNFNDLEATTGSGDKLAVQLLDSLAA